MELKCRKCGKIFHSYMISQELLCHECLNKVAEEEVKRGKEEKERFEKKYGKDLYRESISADLDDNEHPICPECGSNNYEFIPFLSSPVCEEYICLECNCRFYYYAS